MAACALSFRFDFGDLKTKMQAEMEVAVNYESPPVRRAQKTDSARAAGGITCLRSQRWHYMSEISEELESRMGLPIWLPNLAFVAPLVLLGEVRLIAPSVLDTARSKRT